MYLKSFKLCNFRKFGKDENEICFVSSKNIVNEEEKLNVACGTTLIIGKNNSGKTTITKALDIILNKGSKFNSNDFNYIYLMEIFNRYNDTGTNKVDEKEFIELIPKLEFEFSISIDNADNDLLTNVKPFISIQNTLKDKEEIVFKIILKYEINESVKFLNDFNEIKNKKKKNFKFEDFLKLIDESGYTSNYYDENNEKVSDEKVKLSNIMNLEIISANKKDLEDLKGTFNKIINYKYKEKDKEELDSHIENINKKIDNSISNRENIMINDVLHKIESNNKLSISISSDLNYEKLFSNLIRYEYVENKLNIPEGQFGLGYSNLMSIIGKLIDYIEKYPNDKYHSKINLICIEEPEAFMHPQMQERFIKNINDAIKALLDTQVKKINTQLIVTTHSSHILNSKIHSSQSFDNISYLTTIKNKTNIINLNDKKILKNSNSPNKKEELKFLKKHIKYKVSELFFSDAVIFAEGITEATLLPFYIDREDILNEMYISIFNIGGAHAFIYDPLIKILRVPTLIITDIDIKRDDKEKDEFVQIKSLTNKITTNETIKFYNNDSNDLSKINKTLGENNLKVVFQKEKIEKIHARSFEESLILTNYDNDCLNNVLENVKPSIYKNIITDKKVRVNLIENSFKLQSKLSKDKSDFANEFLFELLTLDDFDEFPNLPKYITQGLNWLKKELIVGR